MFILTLIKDAYCPLRIFSPHATIQFLWAMQGICLHAAAAAAGFETLRPFFQCRKRNVCLFLKNCKINKYLRRLQSKRDTQNLV